MPKIKKIAQQFFTDLGGVTGGLQTPRWGGSGRLA